jgi:hypothetical protein
LIQKEIEKQLSPLVGLKLAIARRAADLRNLHFGEIRKTTEGSFGDIALHIQCQWRISDDRGIITGRNDLWKWALGKYPPDGWKYDNMDNLQDVMLHKLLKGYDLETRSYINLTDKFVVNQIHVTPLGDVTISLSPIYQLSLFLTQTRGEAWRIFKPGDLESHFVLNYEDVMSDLNVTD